MAAILNANAKSAESGQEEQSSVSPLRDDTAKGRTGSFPETDDAIRVASLYAESIVNSVREPCFTTKSKGLWMGLALSRSILEAHCGRIWMEAAPESGPAAVVGFSMPLDSRYKRRKEATE